MFIQFFSRLVKIEKYAEIHSFVVNLSVLLLYKRLVQ